MVETAKYKKGSTAKTLFFGFDPAIDLSAASAPLFNSVDRWGAPAIVDGVAFIANGTYEIAGLGLVTLTPAEGVMGYSFGPTELDLPGFYKGWFSVLIAGKPWLGPDYGFAHYQVEDLK